MGAVVALAEIPLVVRVVKVVLDRAAEEVGSMYLTAEDRPSMEGLPGQCSQNSGEERTNKLTESSVGLKIFLGVWKLTATASLSARKETTNQVVR
jgi:hypothetical protein